MPAFETMDYYQRAVVWGAAGVNRYNQPVPTTPVEIDCRWTTNDQEVTDAQGDKISLDAQLMTDEDVELNSLVWLGTMDDWTATGSSLANTMLMQVKTRGYAMDLKGRVGRKTYGLVKFRNTVPA